MASLPFTLRLRAPVFFVIAAMHSVVGLETESMLGAQAVVLASFFGGLGVALLVSSTCTRALQSILSLFPDSDWTFGLNAWGNLSNPDVFNLVERTAEVAISRVWNDDGSCSLVRE